MQGGLGKDRTLSASSTPAGPLQQAKKRTRIAAGALRKNRSDNKPAGMSVVMLHMKTVALIFCTSLNRAVACQYALVMLEGALDVEEFYHS